MKLVKKIGLLVICFVAFSGHHAVAETEQSDNPFAECGIGANLFPKNETAAIISNIVWDLGTTALTSGLSSPDTCAGKKAETAMFIHQTYDLIVEETAKGEGNHLTAMLNLAGCESSLHKAVVNDIREGFTGLVSDSTYATQAPAKKSENFYNVVVTKSAGLCSLS